MRWKGAFVAAIALAPITLEANAQKWPSRPIEMISWAMSSDARTAPIRSRKWANAGTANSGLGYPRIEDYANNDGWFDDTSDGVVMARLVMFSQEVGRLRFIDVEYPAWVIVGYPAYVPEILDIVSLDDVLYDLAIREFAWRTDLYGTTGTFDDPQHIDANDLEALMHWKAGRLEWNPDYKPWFYRDVWPILFRADEMSYLNNVLQQSNFPHNQTQRGNGAQESRATR